jgi:hypothetical protein
MIMIVSSINGDQALIICPVVYFSSTLIVGAGSFANLQTVFGFQNFKKTMRQIMEPIPAITSGSAGPIKFDEDHCRNAKEIPDTSIAGSTSVVFLKPAMIITR